MLTPFDLPLSGETVDAVSVLKSASTDDGSAATSSSRVSSTTILLISVGTSVAFALIAAVGSAVTYTVQSQVRGLDRFSRQHYVPLGQAVTRKQTVLGGVVSVAMVILVIGLAADTALSFIDNNVTSTTSLVSTERAPVSDTRGLASLQAALIASRDVTSAPCPLPNTWSVTSGWTVDLLTTEVPASPTCTYLLACASCRVESAHSLALVLRPSSNGLVTELSTRLTPVQAISLLVGAVGGLTTFFALVNSVCEQLSRAVVAVTRDRRWNFAEAELDTVRTTAPRPSIVGAKGSLLERSNPMHSRRTPAERAEAGRI
jgi:hypothetical protein